MAKNEPNKPDEKTVPEKEAPAKEQTVPIEAASKEMGEAKAGPPSPVSGDRIPTPGDIVVSFDKIKEMVSEKQAARKETEVSGPAAETAQSNKIGPKAGDNRFSRNRSCPLRLP